MAREVKRCKFCRKAFLTDKRHPSQKFCSVTCRNKNYYRKKLKESEKTRGKLRVCGNPKCSNFIIKFKFCSHKCQIVQMKIKQAEKNKTKNRDFEKNKIPKTHEEIFQNYFIKNFKNFKGQEV